MYQRTAELRSAVALTEEVCYPVNRSDIMNDLFKRRFSVRALHGLVPIVTAVLTMACHNSPPLTHGYPLQESLKRKSKDEILFCAGPPVRDGQTEISPCCGI